MCHRMVFEGGLADVNADNDPRREKYGNLIQFDFVNLDKSLGSVMLGSSLSVYLKHSATWENVSRQQ